MTTPEETKPEFPYLLASGAHGVDSDDCCLLEACSIPVGTLPAPGVDRTDRPPDVCSVRAAFGRSLNDSYGRGDAADLERTRDLWPLVETLRGTAARKDGQRVSLYLVDRTFRDWYPRSLALYAKALRAVAHKSGALEVRCLECAGLIDTIVGRLRGLAPITDVGSAALAALADLAARAARAALAGDPALAEEIRTTGRELRREMAAALLETCQSDWK